jgi:hypothetical protein
MSLTRFDLEILCPDNWTFDYFTVEKTEERRLFFRPKNRLKDKILPGMIEKVRNKIMIIII